MIKYERKYYQYIIEERSINQKVCYLIYIFDLNIFSKSQQLI